MDTFKQYTSIDDLVFNDPLSETTRKKRNPLLATAFLALLVSTYGQHIKKLSYYSAEVGSLPLELTEGVLSSLLMYFVLTFTLYAWQDIRKWQLGKTLVDLGKRESLIDYVHATIKNVERAQAKGEKTYHDILGHTYLDVLQQAAAHITQYTEKVATAIQSHKTLSRAQYFRLYVIEVGMPVLLACFAMRNVGRAFFPFWVHILS